MKIKFDIIIPVYNNVDDLLSTLLSLGNCNNINSVIIVDDCSTFNNDYTIINLFKDIYPIKLIILEQNVGPGAARQEGMKYITANYFMFIDAGDTIFNLSFFKQLTHIINEYPNINVFSCAH